MCVPVWSSTIPHCSSAATFNRATFLRQSNQMRKREEEKEGEREGHMDERKKEREIRGESGEEM